MVSLIDSIASGRKTQEQRPRIKRDLNTIRNVKPARPKGYLVETPLYMAPVEYCKDLAKDTYGIIKGFQGKANDHELGKQNDVAMKLGSLGIAAYLMTFRKAKLPKMMELVGFGTFFGSMALWPKLAISLPLKLRTGVDMQQEYVDSYGRKKKFFMDPQYLAWDLFSRDKIQKMGDKMNVPYDVPNRDEVIQEKARKLAVQGNTMWMATAGFAAPIMTSLICNQAEPLVETLKQKYDIRHTQKVMDGHSWFQSSTAAPKNEAAAFEKFITENMGKKVRPTEDLVSILNWTKAEVSTEIGTALKDELSKLLTARNDIDSEFVDGIYKTFEETLKDANVDKKAVEDAFKANKLFGSADEAIKRFNAVNPKATVLTTEDAAQSILRTLIDKNASKESAEKLKSAIDTKSVKNFIEGTFNFKTLDEKTAKKLRDLFNVMSNYFQQEKKLVDWVGARCANSADSMSSYSWKQVTKSVFSTMGFSGKELSILEKQGPKSKELLVAKLEELAKDPQKYKKVISKVAKCIAEFDLINSESARRQYFGYVDTLCNVAQTKLHELGFEEIAQTIGGKPFTRDAEGKITNFEQAVSGSIRNAKKVGYDARVLGEKSSFYRLIQTFDLFKKIQDGTFEGQFKVITALKDPKTRNPFVPSYTRVKKFAVESLLSSNSGIQNDKLGFSSTTNTYKTIMRILYGALPDDYVHQAMRDASTDVKVRRPIIQACEQGTEKGYQAAVNAGLDKVKLNMARTGMTKETLEGLYDASVGFNKKNATRIDLVENIKTYMQTFIDKVVNFNNGIVKNQNLCNETDISGATKDLVNNRSPKLKQDLVGLSPEKFFRESAQKLANTKKWLKVFGIGGAVLFAGTVISTLFFGHIPTKEMYMRENNGKNGK